MQVILWQSPKIALNLRMAKNKTEAFDTVSFVARDPRVAEDEQRRQERERKEQERKAEEESDQMFAENLSREIYLVSTQRAPVPNDNSVSMSLGPAGWQKSKFGVPFNIRNDGQKPFVVGEVRAKDGNGRRIDARTLFPTQNNGQPEPLLIPPGGRLRGTVIVPNAATARLAGLTIEVTESNGLAAVIGMAPTWEKQKIDEWWIPMTEEEAAERAREREEEAAERERERENERERGKKTLSLQAIYGVTWLDDATPDTEELDATDIKGLGVRLNYGFNRYLAVEVDVTGASTGKAEFGAMTRSATMGRVSAGGLLRLGSGRYVPILRGLVGFQGASYDGVGDGFEFAGLWSIGAGLDAKAGPFVLGLAVTGLFKVQTKGSSIEAGLHLGYAWK